MPKLKNIALLFFASFLFLGVGGISISEHICTITEKICEMHEDHHQQVAVKHDCCETPNQSNDGDCCKEESKVFQTTLNHYHDVLVKVTVPYLTSAHMFDTYLAVNSNESQVPQYYPNPPPLSNRQQRAQLQIYIL